MYDYLVFIGRFQPFHLGHQEVVDRALSLSKKVIILVGGYLNPRDPIRGPWTFEERRDMIRAVYGNNPKLIIKPIRDFTYNDNAWIAEVQHIVKDTVLNTRVGFNPDGMADYKIGLIGCEKDHSSYYLKLFPNWGHEAVHFVNPINATDIRTSLYNSTPDWEKYVSNPVKSQIYFDEVIKYTNPEYHWLMNYREMHNHNPYPAQHLAADALVIQSGHVLLVERGKLPGKGLLAMPGGFKNTNETFLNAAIRELREETKLKVPEKVLRGSITDTFIADHPYRSGRGTVVSAVYKFELENGPLPKVKGSDDAAKAIWVPLTEVKVGNMFEDHFHIINRLV